jgi:hypothetical protein
MIKKNIQQAQEENRYQIAEYLKNKKDKTAVKKYFHAKHVQYVA